MVSIGSTLLTLRPLKNSVYAPSGAILPEGCSFDVRKVIGSSPISSTKPDRKVGLFPLSSGKSLAVGQITAPSRYRPPKRKTIRMDGLSFWYGIPDMGLEQGGLACGKAKKCPGDTFLARGRVLWSWGHSPQDCGHTTTRSTKPDRKVGLFPLSSINRLQWVFNVSKNVCRSML